MFYLQQRAQQKDIPGREKNSPRKIRNTKCSHCEAAHCAIIAFVWQNIVQRNKVIINIMAGARRKKERKKDQRFLSDRIYGKMKQIQMTTFSIWLKLYNGSEWVSEWQRHWLSHITIYILYAMHWRASNLA